ncbi:hypothetical protein HPB50_024627 [Hyalomma asiaticum]|uniref:Uncharacterized protein n=1 Tax=Hyalomma asiaticum TaxID=266040 RepID=A0ACB7SA32_HYAAI|nr:hypothetical protein HPB50_024627 [Hyalomma asiaticum]
MSPFWELRTFLWRRLFLQTIRRHYLALLTEVFFVLAVFSFFLRHDRVDLALVKKLNTTFKEELVRFPVPMEAKTFDDVCVVYGPSNEITDEVVKTMVKGAHRSCLSGGGIGGQHHKPSYDTETDEYPPIVPNGE